MICKHCKQPIKEAIPEVQWDYVHESGWHICVSTGGATIAEPEEAA